MNKDFKSLKKKSLYAALLKSAIVGVFCALLAIGAILLILKPNAKTLFWAFYLLIGVGVASAGFGITYLFVRPTDKKLARRLDKDYELHEKVQTMVEFDGQEGDMLRLQRENANETLKNTPAKRPSFKRIWQYVAIPVVALAVFVTGVAIPKVNPPAKPDPGAYEVTESQVKRLEQLIGDVTDSSLLDAVKEPAKKALEELLEDLKVTKQSAGMQRKVIDCVKTIEKSVQDANTYREIVLALNEDTSLNAFNDSILNATISYGGSIMLAQMETEGTEILSTATVKSLAAESNEKIRNALSVFIYDLNGELYGNEEPLEKPLSQKEISEKLYEFLDPFNAQMGELVETFAEDPLFIAFGNFSSQLGEPAEQYAYMEEAQMQKEISDAFENYRFDVAAALEPQVYNLIMDEYIRNQLHDIFDVELALFPEMSLILPSKIDSGEGKDMTNDGGKGDKEVIYGSDDNVYDPENSEHVKYGEVLDRYMEIILRYMNDPDAAGDLSDEMKYYINQYLNALNGNEQSEN